METNLEPNFRETQLSHLQQQGFSCICVMESWAGDCIYVKEQTFQLQELKERYSCQLSESPKILLQIVTLDRHAAVKLARQVRSGLQHDDSFRRWDVGSPELHPAP